MKKHSANALTLFPTFTAMIKSMTGFGKCQVTIGLKFVNIDIRTLNSKQLDLNLRLPQIYREKEGDIRLEINKLLERGKIDVYINRKQDEALTGLPLDREAIKLRFRELESIAAELGVSASNLLPEVLRMPDLFVEDEEELSELEWKLVKEAFRSALLQTDQFRTDEGAGLETELNQRVENISALLQKIGEFEASRMEGIKNRLSSKIEELNLQSETSANRFEEEMIYFLERLDITEEKQRLASHLNYFKQTMNDQAGASGRKLGFITQELGREINTIGSKANHAEMQKNVVLMKDELEKIKEQLNNVL